MLWRHMTSRILDNELAKIFYLTKLIEQKKNYQIILEISVASPEIEF